MVYEWPLYKCISIKRIISSAFFFIFLHSSGGSQLERSDFWDVSNAENVKYILLEVKIMAQHICILLVFEY